MKNLIAFLAFVMMSQAYAQAPAQVQYVAAPQAPIVAQAAPSQPKKTLIYDERTNQLVEVAPQVQAQASAPAQVQAEATANAPSASPIYILNNQRLQGYQGTAAIQDAPTTVVQEAPAKISASETIRKERQGAEAATEDGIVQTLEKARLDDEVRRREKFNNALTGPSVVVAPVAAQAASAQATSIVNAPGAQQVITNTSSSTEQTEVVEVIPQKPAKRKKVVLEDETREERVDVKSEVRAALAEQNSSSPSQTQYYVSGLVGTADYGVKNIRSKMSTGFSVGMVTADRFVVEGSFMYGQSEIDNIAGYNANGMTYDFSQYNFSTAVKYQLLPGKLRPTVGAIASYTRRSYSVADGYNYGYGYGSGSSSNTDLGSTDAFDAGLEAGLDIALTNNFSIGADFRYLWNIASKTSNESGYRTYNNNNQRYLNQGIPVVEDLAYYIATVSAKFSF